MEGESLNTEARSPSSNSGSANSTTTDKVLLYNSVSSSVM